MSGFEDLEVWKRAVELSSEVYKGTSSLNDFGFRDQITRSGLSVPSNIAEGMERSSPKDKLKFLDYAKASCGELRTQLIVGQRVGFLDGDMVDRLIAETREVSAMIVGLMKSIR